METITNIRDQLAEFFKKLERKQLIRLIVLAALIVGIVITLVVVLNRKDYVVLYSDLKDEQEQGEIYTRLRNEGVDVRKVGSSIEVTSDVVEQWRMQLSSEGYPRSGRNFDVFDRGSGFGSTDATQQAYLDFQREEYLRNHLVAQDFIVDAWVTLSIQRRPNYVATLNQQPSRVSITLVLADPNTPLTDDQAAAIRNTAVMSVSENLSPENVSIVDTQMRSYPVTDPSGSKDYVLNPDHYLLLEQVQDHFNKSVKELLSPVFESVGVQTAVTLNFDRRVTQSVIFEPPVDGMETGLPISIKNLSESITNAAGVQGEPGLDENGGAPSYIETSTVGDSQYTKASYEANMEVNEIKTLVEGAQGSIESLSIAIVIPLDESMEDYTEDVRDLVAKAVGTPIENVSVHRLPITTPDVDALNEARSLNAEAYRQAEMIRWIVIMAGIIIVVVLLLIALRTVLKALRPEPEPIPAEEGGPALDYIVGDEQELEPPEPTPLEQVQEFIEKDPESVAQLLRNWLSDEYR